MFLSFSACRLANRSEKLSSTNEFGTEKIDGVGASTTPDWQSSMKTAWALVHVATSASIVVQPRGVQLALSVGCFGPRLRRMFCLAKVCRLPWRPACFHRGFCKGAFDCCADAQTNCGDCHSSLRACAEGGVWAQRRESRQVAQWLVRTGRVCCLAPLLRHRCGHGCRAQQLCCFLVHLSFQLAELGCDVVEFGCCNLPIEYPKRQSIKRARPEVEVYLFCADAEQRNPSLQCLDHAGVLERCKPRPQRRLVL